MVGCANCGAENPDSAMYCSNCGATLQRGEREVPRPSTARMRRREQPDYLGAISAGIILIILAVSYLRYPFDFSLAVDYFSDMVARQSFIKPPYALLTPVVFFFNAVGAWSIVLSALRVVFQRDVRRALGDLIGGFFAFFFAFLLNRYAMDLLTGQALLAYFIVGIGVVIVANAIIHFAARER